jgi:hypothetical protein
MTDWIDDLAQKAKDKYAGQRNEDERFNREQKLKETLSKDFFQSLLGALHNSINEFNKKFGSQAFNMIVTAPDSYDITAQFTNKDRKRITLIFKPDRHSIFLGEGNPPKAVGYNMDLAGDSQVFAKLENETLSPDAFARKIITALMNV